MGWGQFEQNRNKIQAVNQCVAEWQGDFYGRLDDGSRVVSSSRESGTCTKGGIWSRDDAGMSVVFSPWMTGTGMSPGFFDGMMSSVPKRIRHIIRRMSPEVKTSSAPQGFEKQKNAIRQHLRNVVYREKDALRERWQKVQGSPPREACTVKGALPLPVEGKAILSEQETLKKELTQSQENFVKQYNSYEKTFQEQNRALDVGFNKMEKYWARTKTEESEHGK